jgi:choline dehydrogenase-like flavoprotein
MIIIGAGPSGCTMAEGFVKAGLKCLLLEAGTHFDIQTYPRKEIDSNSQLYWSGGIEFNDTFDIGLLRPKVVGGGSIVNQALLDPFDEIALSSFREQSGVSWFTSEILEPFYQQALGGIATQEIPAAYRNKNAEVFIEGFKKNKFECAPLIRAQKNCYYELGNDCIECLSGCRINSKQSSSITSLPRAMSLGLELHSEIEVDSLKLNSQEVEILAIKRNGEEVRYRSKYVTLAAGAIGNSKILLKSGLQKKIPAIGKNFYTHPQFMVLGLYQEKIHAEKGPFQSMKSADKNFRLNRFKLENVFGPPVAISMLLPGFGKKHAELMKKITHMACIEVAIRDQNPGEISLLSNGKTKIKKRMYGEDIITKEKGIKAISSIFESTGAYQIIPGEMGIGLHLMGGCNMGIDEKNSVTSPDFSIHHHSQIFCADSSIFPNAPGINPSLTIMALSRMAVEKIKNTL